VTGVQTCALPICVKKITDYKSRTVLLAGEALRGHDAAFRGAAQLLGCTPALDDGDDIALALEAGAEISAARREEFLQPLRMAAGLVVADALLARELKIWLPQHKISNLGMALSRHANLRRLLRKDDLYVIEPRAFHADHEARVRYYDDLRHATGCAMNLDLQRIAIPATARSLPQRLWLEATDDTEQTRWLLQGRKIARIVVESVNDLSALRAVSELPVVLLAELENAENAQLRPS